jgi:hypothetical protein
MHCHPLNGHGFVQGGAAMGSGKISIGDRLIAVNRSHSEASLLHVCTYHFIAASVAQPASQPKKKKCHVFPFSSSLATAAALPDRHNVTQCQIDGEPAFHCIGPPAGRGRHDCHGDSAQGRRGYAFYHPSQVLCTLVACVMMMMRCVQCMGS